MIYRRLGTSGLQLSILSFGSWVSFSKQINDKKAEELMSLAYEKGVNFFDNAEVYALGESEKMMGRVLKKKNWERSSYCVSSKVFFGWHGAENKPNQQGLSRKHIREACDEALQRLQVEYLDLFLCHRPDKNTPIEETVLAMNQLIDAGKILYWGSSEWSAAEIMEAHRVAEKYRLQGPVVEQPQYNLFEREKMEKEYLDVFRNPGMGTTIWSPLASGLLSGKYNEGIPKGSRLGMKGFEWLAERWLSKEKLDKVNELSKLAKGLGITMAQFSIAWCIQNPHVTTAILGATKKHQLLDTLASVDALVHFDAALNAQVDAIMGNKPVLPQY